MTFFGKKTTKSIKLFLGHCAARQQKHAYNGILHIFLRQLPFTCHWSAFGDGLVQTTPALTFPPPGTLVAPSVASSLKRATPSRVTRSRDARTHESDECDSPLSLFHSKFLTMELSR